MDEKQKTENRRQKSETEVAHLFSCGTYGSKLRVKFMPSPDFCFLSSVF